MQHTDNYGMRLPIRGVDRANVDDLNYNMEVIDGAMFDNRNISLKMYNDNGIAVYNTGDIVGQENLSGHISAYVCLEDNVSGAWDATKWNITDLSEQIMLAKQSGGATALDELDDVSITAPTAGQVVTYDGTDWVNADPQGGDVTKTATGNPIELTDGADAPMVKFVTEIVGSQDLHGYDKPWVGGSGKNKLPVTDWFNVGYTEQSGGITFEVIEEGKIKITGTNNSGSPIDFTLSYYSLSINPFYLPNGTYTVSINGAVKSQLVTSGYGNNGFPYYEGNESYTGVISDGTKPFNYVILRVPVDATFNDPEIVSIQYELGSTATPFTPYSNICPITAYTEGEIEVSDGDGNTTTHTTTYPSAIYRGSEDVVNGEVTSEWGSYTFTGNEAWTLQSEDTRKGFSTAYLLRGVAKLPVNNYYSVPVLSEIGNFDISYNTLQSYDFAFCIAADGRIGITRKVYDNISVLTGVTIYFELATPQTSSVTPTNLPIKTLSGYNHIESSTGEMEIEYITQSQQPLIDLIRAEKGDTYSTSEQIIGKWIDGSILYRKTYTYSGTGAANPFTTTIDMTGKEVVDFTPHYARYTYSGGTVGVAVGSELYHNNGSLLSVMYYDEAPPILTVSANLGSTTETYEICFSISYIKTSNNRILAKSAPTEEVKEEPEEVKESEELKEEVKEEIKEEPEEKVEEEKEENENQSESSTR